MAEQKYPLGLRRLVSVLNYKILEGWDNEVFAHVMERTRGGAKQVWMLCHKEANFSLLALFHFVSVLLRISLQVAVEEITSISKVMPY